MDVSVKIDINEILREYGPAVLFAFIALLVFGVVAIVAIKAGPNYMKYRNEDRENQRRREYQREYMNALLDFRQKMERPPTPDEMPPGPPENAGE